MNKIRFRNFSNTGISLISTAHAFVHRLIIVNAIFFTYGVNDSSAAYMFLAYTSLSTALMSYMDLMISKNYRISYCALHIKNIIYIAIITLLFGVFTSVYDLFQLSLAFAVWCLASINISYSGLYFKNDKFREYRMIHIFGEQIEIIFVIFCCLFLDFTSSFLIIISLLIRHIFIMLCSSTYYLKYKIGSNNDVVEEELYKIDVVSVLDVLSSLSVTWLLPSILSAGFGPEAVSKFTFLKQFYSVGNLIQKAIFRGYWRDHLSGSINAIYSSLVRKSALIAGITGLLISYYVVGFLNLGYIFF